MKKLILLALVAVMMAGCETQVKNNSKSPSNKWIIESKNPPIFFVGYTFTISNVEDVTLRKSIEVGKYTFNSKNIGDTITLNM